MAKTPKGYEQVKAWMFERANKIQSSNWTQKRIESELFKLGQKTRQLLWQKEAYTKDVKEVDKYHEQKEGELASTSHYRYVTRLRRDIEESNLVNVECKQKLGDLVDSNGLNKKLEHLAVALTETGTHRDCKKLVEEAKKALQAKLKRSKKESTIKAVKQAIKDFSKIKIGSSILKGLSGGGEVLAQRDAREKDLKDKYQSRPRNFAGLEVMGVIHKLLNEDNDWSSLTLGVALATGRRCVEVFHYGEFEEDARYSIKFKGVRKSEAKANEEYTFPSLVESSLVIKAVEKLRASSKYKDVINKLSRGGYHEAEFARRINQAIANKVNLHINVKLNEVLPKPVKWVFKDSRAIYARLSYAIYCANCKKAGREPMQELGYFKSVLLHTDYNETLSYLQFRLTDSELVNAYQIGKARESGKAVGFKSRLPLLVELTSHEGIQRRALQGCHHWVIEQIKANEDLEITTSLIRNEKGGSPHPIGDYVRWLKAQKLDKPNLILDVDSIESINETRTKSATITVAFESLNEIQITLKKGATDEEWKAAFKREVKARAKAMLQNLDEYEPQTHWNWD
ncbi:TPA: hypothetical protein VGT19_005443 [Vibrio harveyi]|nr:hypothetical protein [Vibrio harveyi]